MVDKRILENIITTQKSFSLKAAQEEFKPRFAARHIDLSRNLICISGVRGAGKTTIAINALTKGEKAFAYVDISELRRFNPDDESLQSLLEVLYMVYGTFEWIILDEINCVEEWKSIISYFRTVNIKVIALFSGCVEDPRFNSTVLYPLSFSEYCLWHDIDTSLDDPLNTAQVRKAFDDFSLRGGFPGNQYTVRAKGWAQRLLTTILEKDLRGDIRKSNLESIREIGRYLATNSPVNAFRNEIATAFGLKSENTANKYISKVKDTACVYPLERFAFQDRQRNYCERIFAVDPSFCSKDEKENALKTIVYMQLRRFCERHGYQMHYYVNRDFECDFALCDEMKMRTLIQVIYNYSDTDAIKSKVAGLISLSLATGCDRLYILTDNCHDTIEAKGLNIFVKPAYEFLLDKSHMIITPN